MSDTLNTPFPTYKGKPFVRCGDTIYLGDMSDRYVVKMDIKTKKKVKDIEIADKVSIQLICTDPTVGIKERVEKHSEKNGLYLALDIANVWLERKLSE